MIRRRAKPSLIRPNISNETVWPHIGYVVLPTLPGTSIMPVALQLTDPICW
jgi:hypothetical protein